MARLCEKWLACEIHASKSKIYSESLTRKEEREVI